MAILNTATGTVAGDVAQIRTAIYGREVRASIAEAIELLDSSVNGDGEDSLKSRLAALQAELEALRKEAESVRICRNGYRRQKQSLQRCRRISGHCKTTLTISMRDLCRCLRQGTAG